MDVGLETCSVQAATFVWALLVFSGGAVLAAAASTQPQIYVYPLPDCSFDHFAPEQLDGHVAPFHSGRPPILPIHRRIAKGLHVTSDPSNATSFYIPAPFALWDSSWLKSEIPKICPWTFYAIERVVEFRSPSMTMELPDLKFFADTGRFPRTISLWIKAFERTEGDVALLVVGDAAANVVYGLGLRRGCPLVFGLDALHASSCNTTVDDGEWHHVAATYDSNGTSGIFVDDRLMSSRLMEVNVSGDLFYYGGMGNLTSSGNVSAFEGEMRALKIFDEVLTDVQVRSCVFKTLPDLDRTPDSRCFRLVRKYVEDSPWFKRSGGWDHFVLIAGFDYPAAFDPLHPPADEDYVLEAAWPEFGRFSVLHFGARTERCFSSFVNALYASVVGEKFPSCVRRFFRTITIPPLLQGERFDCAEMSKLMETPRHTRIAYRGLAYGPMIERSAMRNAGSESAMSLLKETRQIRLEFTNWSHELLDAGVCRNHFAFDGLCPWSGIGRQLRRDFGKTRVKSMKKRSLELWADSETCLVLPGDGGYELRLYSMINLGCVPVIINANGVSLPKVPFPNLLAWHKFAIFWSLDTSREDMLSMTAHQLLTQLLAINKDAIVRKRANLMRYAHGLSWHEPRRRIARCGSGNRRPSTALDLLLQELAARTLMPTNPAEFTHEWWRWKIPIDHMKASSQEDVTGNGCPLGFPYCDLHDEERTVGDTCKGSMDKQGYRCPHSCEKVSGPPFCVQEGTETPCEWLGCYSKVRILEPAIGERGLMREPRVALVSFSDRPQLSSLTRPSLERFCDEHPGRYDLLIDDEPLLNPYDFHAAWNKLAFVRRAFILNDYDVVVWVDDDVLITDPTQDPIYEAITERLLTMKKERLVLATLDTREKAQVPLNTGVFAMKKGRPTMKLIEQIFRIGRRQQRTKGKDHYWLPRKHGSWDQDAFAIYMEQHGRESFELVEHGVLQSFVRRSETFWRPGDFAAHFTGMRKLDVQLRVAHQFLTNLSAGQAGGWLAHY